MLLFVPDPDHATLPFQTTALPLGFTVWSDDGMLDKVRSVRVYIDGQVTEIIPEMDITPAPPAPEPADEVVISTGRPRMGGGIKRVASWHYAQSQYEAVVAPMIAAKAMAFALFDERGKQIARYDWDVHKLRDIPELLDLVHWSCTSPDRG
jgi:hypothetical protein